MAQKYFIYLFAIVELIFSLLQENSVRNEKHELFRFEVIGPPQWNNKQIRLCLIACTANHWENTNQPKTLGKFILFEGKLNIA